MIFHLHHLIQIIHRFLRGVSPVLSRYYLFKLYLDFYEVFNLHHLGIIYLNYPSFLVRFHLYHLSIIYLNNPSFLRGISPASFKYYLN
jgi:hypothetical protein